MKKLLLLTLTLFTIAIPATQSAYAEPKVRRAEPVERTEKKPGLFERLFKKRREDRQKEPPSTNRSEPESTSTPPTKKAIATEASEIEATPKPKPRRKSASKSTPTPAPLDDQSESSPTKSELSPSPEPESTPDTADLDADSKNLASQAPPPNLKISPASEPELKPQPTPTMQKELYPAQLTESVPFVSTPKPEQSAALSIPDLLDPEYVKRVNERYKDVRSKALEDKKISALKDEADGAFEPAKRAEVLKVYYEALFQKMREIDPSLKRRIDGREKATMRRIESLTPVGE